MKEILEQLVSWRSAGTPVALARVTGVSRSAPRQPGAAMAVAADGEVAGSVSGGCVEGAVYELGQQVLTSGEPVKVTYGISDDDAFAVGLTCGGELDVFVQPLAGIPGFDRLAAAVEAGDPAALATVVHTGLRGTPGATAVVTPDTVEGTLGTDGLDVAVVDDARGMLEQGQTGLRRYGPDGQRRVDDLAVFVQSFAPPPRMLVFGAIDFAAAVARMGVFLGYRVTVCDARELFATRSRFPDAHEIVVDWPHRFLQRTPVDARTVICVLTHDPKFDVPVLEVALRTNAAYVGAMGSRRTHADRLARLRERGLAEAELERLRSPIGLDIGARTPEETAVSIAAELVQQRWGGSGLPLRRTDGRIHGRAPDRDDVFVQP
ncbi:MAG TPA: XdhC/CoxI family protein [Egibacteraceae bacterium]|nr:XdhC/CoxI family protein [Egibacteraceae bacterium]